MLTFSELRHKQNENEVEQGRSNQCKAVPSDRHILEGLLTTLLAKMETNKNVNPDASTLKATIDSLEKAKLQISILNETLSDSVEVLEMIVENFQTYPGTSLIISGIQYGANANLEELVRNKLINYLHLPKSYAVVINPKAHQEAILFDCSTKLSKGIILYMAKQKLGASEIKIEDFIDLQNLIDDSDQSSLLDVRMKEGDK